MKRVLSTLCASACCLASLFNGCAPSREATVSELYVPHFNWSPPTKAAIASADVTLAVVSPVYATKEEWLKVATFKNFQKSLGINFEELLISKGFTIKGPFDALESMTYPDKKGADLAVYPLLEINLDGSNFRTKAERKFNLLGPDNVVYTQEGEILLGGRVSLVALEPLSGEKMWTKNIALDEMRIACKSERDYRTPQEASATNASDPGIMNPLSKALESYYPRILQTAWEYINSEEMALVKKKSQEVRAKKVY